MFSLAQKGLPKNGEDVLPAIMVRQESKEKHEQDGEEKRSRILYLASPSDGRRHCKERNLGGLPKKAKSINDRDNGDAGPAEDCAKEYRGAVD